MRNAFEVLAAGAKVNNNNKASRTPADGKGTYTVCPLCQRTVPLSFADAHVSVCLATPRPTSRGQSLSQPRGSSSLPSPALGNTTPHAQIQPHLLTPEARFTPIPSAAMPQPLLPHHQQSSPQPHNSLQLSQQQDSQNQRLLLSQHHQNQPGKQLWEGQSEIRSHEGGAFESPNRPPETIEPTGGQGGKVAVATPLTAATPSPPPPPPVATAIAIEQDTNCDRWYSREQTPCAENSTTQSAMQLPVPFCTPRPRPRCIQAGGVSAFDIMRMSQLRAASRCHTFFLERTATGSWLGHCWAKGCASPQQQRLAGSSCWSVTLTVGSAGSRAAGGGAGIGDAAAGKETVVLHTNVPPGDGGGVSWSSAGLPSNDLPPEGRWRGGPSALKSALQKAVRLGRGSCAVRAALHLFKEDGGAAQLLRRLSIVCVEDAILHPGLPFVVWLMAAQAKGFVLGRTHLDALLCLVYQLAMVQVRDGLPDPWDGGDSATVGTPVDATSQGPVTLQQVDELALPAAETCLVKCLLFRASYGGMGGDVRMMKIFAGYWAARFKGSAAPPPLLTVPPPSPGHQCRPWSDSTTAVLSSSPGVATRAQPRGPVASGPNRPYPGLGPLTEPLPQAPCAAGPTANTEGTEQLPAGRNRAIAVVVQPGPQPLERAPGPNLGTKNTSPGTRDVAAAGACKRAATQAFGGAESTPNCKSHGVLAGESFASPGDGPCQPSLAPGLQSQQLRRRSGAGPTSGGTQADWAGASQLSPADLRVSDAYFAARLQAEDAPPSCGVFVPASQLLAEAVNEQRSLQRMAATAPRQQLHSQAQQWPPYHLQAYPQASTHSWNVADAANASDGNCRSSHGHMGGGDGLTGSAWYGHASQASQGTFASETPAACAFSIGKFPSLTQLQLQQQQDVVLPKWHSRYAGGCTAAAAAAKVGATCGDGGSDGVSGADYVVPTDGDKGECSAWLTYLCSLYDQVTVPVALAMTSSVGPMRRSDVPLSAVDFHISDIVTRLMERSEVVALAPGGSAEHAGTPEDTEDALKSAMWLFRSSKNSKVWVHRLSPCCQHLHASGGAAAGTRGGACAEHRSLEAQFEREESSRRRLAALWSAAAPWADRFSVSYIARRFGPP